MPILPRYPIYVPSRGRFESGYTLKFLAADGVPHHVVVEQHERDEYARRYPAAALLVLPESGQGLIYARNFIKQHATASGVARHWQLDDNIKQMRRWYKGKRIRCSSGVALRACEDFVDRYTNVAIAGPNYTMFAHQSGKQPRDPFWLNVHVYSASLVLNALPFTWRSVYNDDTDMCLQCLAAGWCTVSFNAFMIDKIRTMVVKGGNTQALYQGDGRLKMARALERLWPGVVTTERRWQRPQHVVKGSWRKFDTPLQLRDDIDISALEPNEYGMQLQARGAVKSATLRRMLEDSKRGVPS